MLSIVIFILLLLFPFGNTVKLIKTELRDSKLCNTNDYWATELRYRPSKCFNSFYTKRFSCDSRVIAQVDCMQLEINVDCLTQSLMNQISREIEYDHSIRRITIVVYNKALEFDSMGGFVDSFLQPHPAWSVMKEPYVNENPYHFIFERYNQLWDPYLDLLTQNQYPSGADCKESYLVVQRQECVHPGYSDVRRHYYSEMRNFTHIMGIYVPAQDIRTNHTGFISASDCPATILNKWQCAFLLPTNCSLPYNVKNHKSAFPNVYRGAFGTGELQSIPLNMLEEHIVSESKENSRQMIIHQQLHLIDTPGFVYIAPYSNETNMYRFHGVGANQSLEFIFMNFLFRKTFLYRRKVAETLQAFREKYHLGENIRTNTRRFVAAHIRRGDRTVAGVNMVELCYNATKPRVNGEPNLCLDKHHHLNPCPDTHVYGCDAPGDIPVGAVTLAAVTKQAEFLVGPSIRNMIVFSDDGEWLAAEIERLRRSKSSWKIYSLDAPPLSATDSNRKGSNFDSRKDGTAAGVLFQATIELAQQCDALIGHFTSGVPLTLAGAMCHHHAELEGVCPPVYDMKLGL